MATLLRHMTPRRWALAAALFAGVLSLGLTAVADGDVFWHLAAGREMVRTRGLLVTDPFSISAAGRPWVDLHWLFQLLVYAVHELAGLPGLVLCKALLLAAGALVSFLALARTSARSSLPVLVIALLSSLFFVREQLQLRPVIGTLFFLSVFFFELEGQRIRPSFRTLWTLPLLVGVWANVQGLFLLGPAMIAAYAVGAVASFRFGDRAWFPFPSEYRNAADARRASRTLGLTLALSLGACLLTPFGVHGARLPALLLSRLLPSDDNVFSANIAENVPPFAAEGLLPGQFSHLEWFFGFLFLSFALPGRRLRLSHASILVALAALALLANRNIVLLYWVGAPIAVMTAAPGLRRVAFALSRFRALSAVRGSGYALIAALLLLVGTAAAREPDLRAPAPFRVPEGSARWIERAGRPSRIFSADNYGGYLIYRLFPAHRPYLDTRLILRTAEEYREYLRVVDEPSRFEAFQRRHRFDYVVLPTAYPDRYLGLIAYLHRSPDWKLVYTDGTETLFADRTVTAEPALDLSTSSATSRIVSALSSRYDGDPTLGSAARVQFATLLLSLAEVDQAERALSGATSPQAQALRARCRLARGDLDGALEIASALAKRREHETESLGLLAMVALGRGEVREATTLIGRALAIHPRDPEVERILSSMEDRYHAPSP